MKPLFLAFLLALGDVTAPPNDLAEVPVVVEADSCVVGIEAIVGTDLELAVIMEGPNALASAEPVPGGYRIVFEIGTCASGEIARILFRTPDQPGAHLLQLQQAEYQLNSGVVAPMTTNGKVRVLP